MIYEKNQSLKRSGDRRQEALEEQKGSHPMSVAGPGKTRAPCAGTTTPAFKLLLCLGVLTIYIHEADKGKEMDKRVKVVICSFDQTSIASEKMRPSEKRNDLTITQPS
ncbi:hypothetical protein DUI87_11494 [Hirundo rustica rustica]|uniref:Uncharacterized protein n=1 Tax=Hirundo rustica rustica TaxID=333673 RepID=A0A3M0KED0_HIRRU|nr:hypothetical protein DUI87_11494 [Hirundo rustica rustica]